MEVVMRGALLKNVIISILYINIYLYILKKTSKKVHF